LTVICRDATFARQRLAEPDETRLSTPRSWPGRRCPSVPTTELMLMMRPARRLIIDLSTAWTHVNAAVRFVEMTSSHSSRLHAQHQLVARDAGVVHEHVDAAVLREDALDHGLDRGRIRHVQRRALGTCRRSHE
jgi:hypothetical protein